MSDSGMTVSVAMELVVLDVALDTSLIWSLDLTTVGLIA